MFSAYLHSYIISQILGLYLVIMAIILLARAKFYRNLIMNLDKNYVSVMVGSAFGLVIGLIIVALHNLWVSNIHILVTIIGWLILIKSITWLSVPERMVLWSKRISAGSGYYVMIAFMGIIGVLLLAKGYYPFMGGTFIGWWQGSGPA